MAHFGLAAVPKVARMLGAFTDAGLVAIGDDGWVRMNDWIQWQPEGPTAAEGSTRSRAQGGA